MFSYQFIAPIETLYMLKEPFKLGDVTFFQSKGRMFIKTVGEGTELNEARENAKKKMQKACLVWCIKTGESMRFKSSDLRIANRVGFIFNAILAKDSLTDKQKEDMIYLFDALKPEDEYGMKTVTYFQRGRALLEADAKNEAYLNFYKIFELIFEKIFSELTDEEIQKRLFKLKKEVSSKEKLQIMCEKLSINPHLTKGSEHLVNVRSQAKYDVGHSTPHFEKDIPSEDLCDCMNLALDVIHAYLNCRSLVQNRNNQ